VLTVPNKQQKSTYYGDFPNIHKEHPPFREYSKGINREQTCHSGSESEEWGLKESWLAYST